MNRFSLSGLCRKFGAFAAAIVLGGVCTSTFAAQADSSLNQLFRMDVPSKSAQGEGYVGLSYGYLKGEDAKFHELRGFAQYGVTPDIVLQAAIPWRKIKPDEGDGESGIADIRIGAQFNLRQFVDPNLAMTAVQLVVALPTSDEDDFIDKSEFQIEPSFVAYRNFGAMGGGVLGAYAQIGANFSSAAHNIILGVAPTYTIATDWVLISEIFLQCGKLNKAGGGVSDLEWIPGVAFRGLRGFEFAAGVPIGITSDAPDIGFILKANWAW